MRELVKEDKSVVTVKRVKQILVMILVKDGERREGNVVMKGLIV